MHSRIIELKLSPDIENTLESCSIPEWFNSHADYWVESDNHSGDIEWFLGNLEGKGIQVNMEEGSFKACRETALAYFVYKYKEFREQLEQLEETTFEAFASYVPKTKIKGELTQHDKNRFEFETTLWKLNNAHEDKGSFWIWLNGTQADGTSGDDDLYTLDEFMRLLKYETNDDEEFTTFYIGNTMDYHY